MASIRSWLLSSLAFAFLLGLITALFLYLQRVEMVTNYLSKSLAKYPINDIMVEDVLIKQLSMDGLQLFIPAIELSTSTIRWVELASTTQVSTLLSSTVTAKPDSVGNKFTGRGENIYIELPWPALVQSEKIETIAIQSLDLQVTEATSQKPKYLSLLDWIPERFFAKLPSKTVVIDQLSLSLQSYPPKPTTQHTAQIEEQTFLLKHWQGLMRIDESKLIGTLTSYEQPSIQGSSTTAKALKNNESEERPLQPLKVQLQANSGNQLELFVTLLNENLANNLLLTLTSEIRPNLNVELLSLQLGGELDLSQLLPTLTLNQQQLTNRGRLRFDTQWVIPTQPLKANRSHFLMPFTREQRTLWQHPNFQVSGEFASDLITIQRQTPYLSFNQLTFRGQSRFQFSPGQLEITPEKASSISLQGPSPFAQLTTPLSPQWRLTLNENNQWFLRVSAAEAPVDLEGLTILIENGYLAKQDRAMTLQGAMTLGGILPDVYVNIDYQRDIFDLDVDMGKGTKVSAENAESGQNKPDKEDKEGNKASGDHFHLDNSWLMSGAGYIDSPQYPLTLSGSSSVTPGASHKPATLDISLTKPITPALAVKLQELEPKWRPWLESRNPQLADWLQSLILMGESNRLPYKIPERPAPFQWTFP